MNEVIKTINKKGEKSIFKKIQGKRNIKRRLRYNNKQRNKSTNSRKYDDVFHT